MGRVSFRGESSSRDNMVSKGRFSCLLLVGITNTATAFTSPELVYRSDYALDRFTNDGTHVRTM